MTARKERPNEISFQDWLESLHFFDEDIGEGELEPPEDEEDDMEGSFGQELADMSDDEFIEWFMERQQAKNNK